MLSGLLPLLRESPPYARIRGAVQERRPMWVQGPAGAEKAYLLGALLADPEVAVETTVIVLPGRDAAGAPGGGRADHPPAAGLRPAAPSPLGRATAGGAVPDPARGAVGARHLPRPADRLRLRAAAARRGPRADGGARRGGRTLPPRPRAPPPPTGRRPLPHRTVRRGGGVAARVCPGDAAQHPRGRGGRPAAAARTGRGPHRNPAGLPPPRLADRARRGTRARRAGPRAAGAPGRRGGGAPYFLDCRQRAARGTAAARTVHSARRGAAV